MTPETILLVARRWQAAVLAADKSITTATLELSSVLEQHLASVSPEYLTTRIEQLVAERQEIRSLAQQLLRNGGTWTLTDVPDAARGRDLLTELDLLLKRCAR